MTILPSSTSSFITFGCWNKGYCDSSNLQVRSNDFSRVVNTLNQYIDAVPPNSKPKFICVLGDNYYPEIIVDTDKTTSKKTKKKVFSYRDLESGFKCLKKIVRTTIPIDILLGNHDTESTEKMEHLQKSPSPATNANKHCKITDSELDLVRAMKSASGSKSSVSGVVTANHMNLVLYNYRTVGNTIIIMVDSNPYFEEKLNGDCYIPILHAMGKNDVDDIDVHQLKLLQLNWLAKVYAAVRKDVSDGKMFQNVVIMAHHPICCFKMKDGNNRFDTCKTDEYLILCQSIYLTLRDITSANHFYYNSADLHTYQAGIVTLSGTESNGHDHDTIQVYQYIVGTGGTELEPEVSTYKRESKKIDSMHLNYQVTDALHDNGFLVWNVKDSGIDVQFVKAVDSFLKYSFLHKEGIADVFEKLSLKPDSKQSKRIKRSKSSYKSNTSYRVGVKARSKSKSKPSTEHKKASKGGRSDRRRHVAKTKKTKK